MPSGVIACSVLSALHDSPASFLDSFVQRIYFVYIFNVFPTEVMKSVWHQRSYEGSMKSVPDDDLLKMLAKDLDPAHVKQLELSLLKSFKNARGERGCGG